MREIDAYKTCIHPQITRLSDTQNDILAANRKRFAAWDKPRSSAAVCLCVKFGLGWVCSSVSRMCLYVQR